MVVAVNYRVRGDGGESKEYTDFVPIAVFGRTGELCIEKLHKGSAVLIQGRVRSRSKDVKGERRYFTEVVAKKVDFLDRYVRHVDENEDLEEEARKHLEDGPLDREEEAVFS